ncbi:cytochrome P450 3A24-like [Amphiura filiformis]|uniref:cytochrome P450 3A24-like n=1 Tax=Amphiura filiformis TaxID=82378 RepID=UPI003B21CB53
MDVQVEEEVQIEAESKSISITWLLIYTGLALLVANQVYTLTHFWRMGIKGPRPLPLLGNMLAAKKGIIPALDNWSKKYGKCFGIFMGKIPALVISDADMARQILIKDFSSFQIRQIQSFSMPYIEDTIMEASGEVWRRKRSYISPTFSGSKMKQMIPAMNSKCDILMEILKSKEGKSFDSKDFFGAFVLDIIACCAYGLESDCQRNPDDTFLYNTKKLLGMKTSGIMLRMMLPSFLSPLLNKFSVFDILQKESMDFFADIVRKAIELRTESEGTGKDFLQLMIDAAETGDDSVKDGDKDGPKKKIPLTQRELIGQSLLFFFAGYETVSTTMAFAAYALAKYPDVQKRLQEEVDELTSEGEPVSYDAVFKMEYLDKVWCESQRLWPIAFVVKRVCNQEFTCSNGITIPNGQFLNINVWDIHHNPEYWSDPQTFNPENFSKEAKESRHPCAFMPFGAGPRQCVAMRFAILEGKMGLIRMMQKYSLELDPETPELSDISSFGSTKSLYPTKGIHLRALPRE